MARTRFCSHCGLRLKLKGAGLIRHRPICPSCPRRFKQNRLLMIMIPLSCGIIGFAIGHYTRANEPFYFIGTPIQATASESSSAAQGDRSSLGSDLLRRPEQGVESSKGTESICGARTRSGKPCRRRVKDGGFCWQHRGRQPLNKETSAGQ